MQRLFWNDTADGTETVQTNLKKWLTETSELGCGDDITVVMAYFEGEQ